jgi:selenocysteine-specific elongation factor
VIVGTAGHIDHGKTTLVRALTGVDTDRLPEEKRRGITIELGFAPLELEGVGRVGVVDVPGHEAFVRTMVAGATGIDVALLVVAADEGVRPQTREHLAILSLLGVRRGVVALTKRDLVEPDWLALVEEDVRAQAADGPLGDAPVVAVSATTGEGLAELRAELARALSETPARGSDDLFRLPVDRAFTVKGTGTVVTGTVWSGTLRRDATVRVLPSGRTARVRGLHAHGSAVNEVGPGSRAAVALADVAVADVERGAVLVADPSWEATRLLRADVALLPDAGQPLGPRTRVRLHLGTAEVGARVVSSGGAIGPGELKPARLVLDEPVVARAGDRFVLRTASPVTTVGGGTVTDPLPQHRRARPLPPELVPPRERLRAFLGEAGVQGVARSQLPLRLGVRSGELAALVTDAGVEGAVEVAGRLFDRRAFESAEQRLDALVDAHHASHPLEPGASLQSLRMQLAVPAALADAVVGRRMAAGVVELDGGLIRRRGWNPTPSAEQARTMAALRDALVAAGREPPSVPELVAAHGGAVPALLKLLERSGAVVPVEAERYYSADSVTQLVSALQQSMLPGKEYGPAELREILGVSRKYLIPFLEFCDRTGVTGRRVAGRVIRGTQVAG